MKYERCALYL